METFKDRFNRILKIKDIKPIDIANGTGIPKSAISQYMSGLYEPKQKNIYKLAKFLNVSESWLLGYDTSIERIEDDKRQNKDLLGNPIVSLPLLGIVKAGYDYMAQENWEGTIDVEQNLVKDGSDYFALKVKGNSMSPVLVEDDIVIIKKQEDFESGDIVVAIINGDEATIKKGKKSTNGILLQPFNTKYEPLIFTYDEMKTIPVIIVGVVKQLKREF